MKRINTDHSRIEVDVRFQKISQRLRCYIATSRDRDVRMEWSQLRLESGGERGFLHTLVHLEKMRMRATNADPNDFRRSFRRKFSDPHNRQKKGTKLNRT